MIEKYSAGNEKVIREDICELIEKQRPESSVEAFSTGEELLASEGRFDIVFLDIQMDGMNGIEAARSLRKRQEETVLIFITGIKEYVFDALDLYAFQYLLKPLNEKKFVEVLDRAVKDCLIARKAGGCNTIARVSNPVYSEEISFIKEELGLSMIINPQAAAAREMARTLKFPFAQKVDSFAKRRAELVVSRVVWRSKAHQ